MERKTLDRGRSSGHEKVGCSFKQGGQGRPYERRHLSKDLKEEEGAMRNMGEEHSRQREQTVQRPWGRSAYCSRDNQKAGMTRAEWVCMCACIQIVDEAGKVMGQFRQGLIDHWKGWPFTLSEMGPLQGINKEVIWPSTALSHGLPCGLGPQAAPVSSMSPQTSSLPPVVGSLPPIHVACHFSPLFPGSHSLKSHMSVYSQG